MNKAVYNHETRRFEVNGQQYTLAEFMALKSQEARERLDTIKRDTAAHRREQAERGRNSGYGHTRSGKR